MLNVTVRYEKLSSRFQQINLLEYADEADARERRRRPRADRRSNRLPAEKNGGGRGCGNDPDDGERAKKVSVTLGGLHIAVVTDCSRSPEKG